MRAQNEETDFLADLLQCAKAVMDTFGVRYSDVSDDHKIVERWANLQLKLIRMAPRRVHKSARLLSRTIPTETTEALVLVEKKCTGGRDLNPHLTKRLLRPDATDYLFADWAIHHLHLSTQMDGPTFMKRSGQLLFAIFTEVDAYFIDIRPHGQNYVFAQKELLETVHDEWPHLLRPFRLQGVVDISPSIDNPKRIHIMRRAGLMLMHKCRDAVYTPMGGGMTTAATSARVVDEVDRLYQTVSAVEAHTRSNLNEMKTRIREATGAPPTTIDLHLELTDNGFFVVDRASGLGFPIQP